MKNKRKGFTIVELVIVIAVIGILAAVLIPTFGTVIENANRSGALQEAKVAMEMVSMVEDAKLEGFYYIVGEEYTFEYDAGATGITNTKPEKNSVVFSETNTSKKIDKISAKFSSATECYANSEQTVTDLAALKPTGVTFKYNSDISKNVVVYGGFESSLLGTDGKFASGGQNTQQSGEQPS